MSTFGTNNVIFGYISSKMPYIGIFLAKLLKILLLNLKWALSDLSICKTSRKKIYKFVTKNALLGIFGKKMVYLGILELEF